MGPRWLALGAASARRLATTGEWQVGAAEGLVYRGPAGTPRASLGEPPAAALARLRPTELRLPAAPDWGSRDRVGWLRAALAAAGPAGVAVVRVGDLVLRPGDPLEASLITLACSRLQPDRQSTTSRTAPAGGAAPSSTARSRTSRSRPTDARSGAPSGANTSRAGQTQPAQSSAAIGTTGQQPGLQPDSAGDGRVGRQGHQQPHRDGPAAGRAAQGALSSGERPRIRGDHPRTRVRGGT